MNESIVGAESSNMAPLLAKVAADTALAALLKKLGLLHQLELSNLLPSNALS